METLPGDTRRGALVWGTLRGSLRVKKMLSVLVAGTKALTVTNALGSDDNRFAEFGRFAQFLFVDRVLDKHDGSQMSLS